MALSGFDIVSPVFESNRRASSPKVWPGVGRASGRADSSPACGEGTGDAVREPPTPTGKSVRLGVDGADVVGDDGSE